MTRPDNTKPSSEATRTAIVILADLMTHGPLTQQPYGDLCQYVALALDRFRAAGVREWRPVKDFAEHETRILASDGNRAAVVYLSKWSGLWYFDANQKGCNWRLTHWMPLPEPPHDL